MHALSARMASLRGPIRAFVRGKSKAAAGPDFSGFSDPSINLMERILGILHDAEAQQETQQKARKAMLKAPPALHEYDTDFATRLGHDLFDLYVMMWVNENQMLAKNRQSQEAPDLACKDFIDEFARQYEGLDHSWFRKREATHGQLSLYQAIARYYVIGGQFFHRNLRRDVGFLGRELYRLKKVRRPQEYWLKIKVPPPYRFHVDSPLILNATPGGGETNNKRHIFPFWPGDRETVAAFLYESQLRLSSSMYYSLIRSQAYEGKLLFTVLVKKHLHLTQVESRGRVIRFLDRHVDERDPENDIDKVKAVVASKSRVLTRLLSLDTYKASIASRTKERSDEDIIKDLADHFDRYLAVEYDHDRLRVEHWIPRLLAYYVDTEPLEWLKLLQEAVKEYRTMMEEIGIEMKAKKWDERQSLPNITSTNARVDSGDRGPGWNKPRGPWKVQNVGFRAQGGKDHGGRNQNASSAQNPRYQSNRYQTGRNQRDPKNYMEETREIPET